MEEQRKHLYDNSINGVAYMEKVMSMNPLLLHNEICAAAENLRWKHGIKDVSINPWFYLVPLKSRSNRHFYRVSDLWKLYAVSGEDTDDDDDEGGDKEIVSQTPKPAIVPELQSSQNKSSKTYVSSSDEILGFLKKVPNKSSEFTKNEVDPTRAFKKQIRKRKCKKGKSKPLESSLVVNPAKEREEKLISLYGFKAFHIKALEDWLEVMKINYINKFDPVYWPCEPLNFEYDKPIKTQN